MFHLIALVIAVALIVSLARGDIPAPQVLPSTPPQAQPAPRGINPWLVVILVGLALYALGFVQLVPVIR